MQVDELVDRYLSLAEAEGKAPSTLQVERAILRAFLASLAGRATADAAQVQAAWVAEFLETARARGIRQRTVHSYYAIVGHAFRKMARVVGGLADPTAALTVRKGPRRERAWLRTREEMIRAEAAVQRTWKWRPFLLMLHAGLRPKEVRWARCADVLLDRRLLRVRADVAKSRRPRWVPISDALLPDLQGIPQGDGDAWLCLNRMGGQLVEEWTRTFNRDLKRVGLLVTAHGLRHTYVSRLLLAGVPLRKVADWAGHTATEVTDIYSHALQGYDADCEREPDGPALDPAPEMGPEAGPSRIIQLDRYREAPVDIRHPLPM